MSLRAGGEPPTLRRYYVQSHEIGQKICSTGSLFQGLNVMALTENSRVQEPVDGLGSCLKASTPFPWEALRARLLHFLAFKIPLWLLISMVTKGQGHGIQAVMYILFCE
jgi:hypothetical protein